MSDNVIDMDGPFESLGDTTNEVLKRERYWNDDTKSYEDGNGDPVDMGAGDNNDKQEEE